MSNQQSKGGHAAIDSVYDAAERSVDGLAAVLGVDTREERKAPATPATPERTLAAKPQLVLAEAASSVGSVPASVGVVPTSPKFKLVRSVDVATKAASFLITDGAGTSYTTTSEVFAQGVMAELAKLGVV